MKTKSLYIATALLGLLGFSSCSDDWTTPPSVVPSAPEGMEATISIAEFKDLYWSTATNSATAVGNLDNGEHAIIDARIISSDRTGNLYKSFIVQDKDGYCMTVGINKTETYKTYQQGQRILIDCTGLYAGMYNNLFQLGGLGEYNNAPSMTFATEDDFKAHAWPDGFAEPAKIDTVTTTISTIMSAKNTVEGKKLWQSRLIRIDNVSWESAGLLTFAAGRSVESATNRYIRDDKGGRLLVRNSGSSTFWDKTLPLGKGSVTGILSYYGSDWQLMLIDLDGCQGFQWVDGGSQEPGEAVEPNTTIKEFKEMYWSSERNSATLVGKTDDGEDMVIGGVVISSDQSGNIYKNLSIRDESGEALTIAINAKNLYLSYPMGQKIVVKVTGMYAGMYNNLFQLGGLGEYNGAPSMTFVDGGEFAYATQNVGAPNLANARPIVTTIATINAISSTEGMQQWMSQYLQFENVSWQGGGTSTFCDGSSNTNRYIVDASGAKLLVRNNGYANFASQLLPAGTGNVSGILSRYGTDWQLLLIDANSCQDFK